MKVYAVADIHGAQYRMNLVLENVERYQPDLVVICGDITQFGPGDVAEMLLNQIPVETFAIPGNIDTADIPAAIDRSHAENLHLQLLKRNGFSFIGIGGLIPFQLSGFAVRVEKKRKTLSEVVDSQSVLVTHVPPYGVQDKVFLGKHAGNHDLAAFISEKKPRVVLCGHIHEDPGVGSIEGITVVNCSMGRKTQGALVTLSDTVKVEVLD